MAVRPFWGKLVSKAVVTFATGLVPFFITSQSFSASLATLGTGWLVGSSLVSFIGSAILAVVPDSVVGLRDPDYSPVEPAIIQAIGILFMLIAERRLCSRMLHTGPSGGFDSDTPCSSTIAAQDDTKPREMEQTDYFVTQAPSRTLRLGVCGPHQRRVYLFVFAFIAQEIADGITAGYVAMAPPWKPNIGRDGNPMAVLSVQETLYLLSLFKKGATTFAFVTTLLSASLPIAECKRHVLYAAARPLAALLSYAVTVLSGITPTNDRPYIVAMNSAVCLSMQD
ncbi:hypothetical protein GSI_06903 [Ganoderma sinense ZZ0214-1]|uniref:Transporter n=1 Tax=Ganoderma sinense ZZ0214-1 TaxID=1077348 RepID=A0A2G8SAE9_9APHY|nr:hypothetical protein GSI_06903 [Ganoderma sinense ZZ0214-1]